MSNVIHFTRKQAGLVDMLDSLHYDAIELLDKGDYVGYKVKMNLIAEASRLLPDYAWWDRR